MPQTKSHPPLTRDHLRQIFIDSAKPKTTLIGIEAEKFGINAHTGQNVRYAGKNGYLAILGKLYEELGWEITKQKEKFILQMQRGKANLNLESDGRIELAGSPHESIHDLAREFRIHQNEIAEMARVFGINWLGIGYHPVSKNKDIEDLPEPRKDHLIKFFEHIKETTGNDFGLAWFKKTSGIHVNIDYTSEEDFALKSKVFYRLAPLLVGIFANSPFSKGKFTGFMSYRYHVTLNTGIPRFTLSKELFESNFTIDDWLNHVLSLPMLLLQREDNWYQPNITFDHYLKHGFQNHQPRLEDYTLHEKSLWKDLKLKKVIELRCFDSLPPSLVPAVAALIKGIAYNPHALQRAWQITENWTFTEYSQFQQDIAKYGLQARIKDHKALDMAQELLSIAEDSLQTEKILDAFRNSEAKFLQDIKEFIFVKGKSPAEWLVHQWQGEWRENFFPVYDWCQY